MEYLPRTTTAMTLSSAVYRRSLSTSIRKRATPSPESINTPFQSHLASATSKFRHETSMNSNTKSASLAKSEGDVDDGTLNVILPGRIPRKPPAAFGRNTTLNDEHLSAVGGRIRRSNNDDQQNTSGGSFAVRDSSSLIVSCVSKVISSSNFKDVSIMLHANEMKWNVFESFD